MELSRIIDILKKDPRLFWFIVIACLLLGFALQHLQSTRLEAVLLLNVGRTGIQNTSEYTFDSFYRLQADERFADTVVRWLASPRVAEDIYREAGLQPETLDLDELRGAIGAGRLSSQMIEVTFSGSNQATLEALSQATSRVLNRYSENLNLENREVNWFTIVPSDPVIRDVRLSLSLVLPLALAVGLFVAFWTVLFRYYLQRPKSKNDD